jgi:hypothetical protein
LVQTSSGSIENSGSARFLGTAPLAPPYFR